ncbi:hypothetical protein DPMN_128730 [Dreissena polymorpha]|uniref:Uncharacterized protein n=1 Tax=Dreissena polymorpha TaxID=45954 RepID=A0A9D4K0F9_DREPO|nr:hypothetical protein DPMN_128730 [Dreissena polymorpha]
MSPLYNILSYLQWGQSIIAYTKHTKYVPTLQYRLVSAVGTEHHLIHQTYQVCPHSTILSRICSVDRASSHTPNIPSMTPLYNIVSYLQWGQSIISYTKHTKYDPTL